jgi:hypothetical protein
MKELNDFRKFLNEDLDEGVMDKLKKFGKTVKDVADKMDGGNDHGGIFHNVPGGKPTPRNRKEEVKKEQEGEIHEGTWSMGGPKAIDSIVSGLQALIKMADDAQNKKNAAGRGFVNALQNQLKAEGWNNRLYKIVGDDSFFDHYDAANSAAAMRDFDGVKNHLGDAIARAEELKAAIIKNSGLEENDAVLDEVIEETVFDDIDNNMKLIAVHMDAAEALEAIVAEFQAISGGTKMVDKVLKSIVQDYNLTGDAEEYASIGFEE